MQSTEQKRGIPVATMHVTLLQLRELMDDDRIWVNNDRFILEGGRLRKVVVQPWIRRR
jgi:hypothetical protein